MKFNPESLRTRRLAAALSRAELAEKSGVGAESIRRLEEGMTEPRQRTVRQLCEALNVQPIEMYVAEAVPA